MPAGSRQKQLSFNRTEQNETFSVNWKNIVLSKNLGSTHYRSVCPGHYKRLQTTFQRPSTSILPSHNKPKIQQRVSSHKTGSEFSSLERCNKADSQVSSTICVPSVHCSQKVWRFKTCDKLETSKSISAFANIQDGRSPRLEGSLRAQRLYDHNRSVRRLYDSSYRGRVKKLPVFPISRSDVSILCPSIWSQRCSKSIYKNSETPVGSLRSLGFKLVVYLDDIILAASTRDLCIYQGQILIKTLENLGFVINLEKSNLVPSQVVLFLGFVVDSKKMSFSLPDSKIQSIRLSAQTLLNQRKVSLRKLSQFIGMCNASRTAVLEAPLHYRSIQNQLTSTLRSQPITQQNYDVKICLNSHSRKDLTWWVKNLKTNCSRPIHPPPVDLSIMSDASDLAWGAHLESVRIQGFWRSHQFSWHINRKS